MNRRVAVVGADGDFQLAEHALGFFLALAQHAQGAHTLSVEAEAFRERCGYKKVQAGGNKLADHGAVFGNAVTKALVGHV